MNGGRCGLHEWGDGVRGRSGKGAKAGAVRGCASGFMLEGRGGEGETKENCARACFGGSGAWRG